MTTYTIENHLLDKLQAKLNAMKSKLSKAGQSFTYEVVDSIYSFDKRTRYSVVKVEASYKINGYELIAVLDYDEVIGKNIIKNIDTTVEVPEEYRTRTECDHCKSKRARLHTALLRNQETGKFIQVGKTCLKDFLGVDVCDYASYLAGFQTIQDYIDSLENKYCGDGSSHYCYPIEELLEQASEYTIAYGFHSRKDEEETGETSTATMVKKAFLKESATYKLLEVSDKAIKMTRGALEWLKEQNESSTYIYNLKSLVEKEYIKIDEAPMMISLIGCYLRELAKRESESGEQASEYVGKVGDKIEITGCMRCVTAYRTEYGTTYIYEIKQGNNVFIWKTGNDGDTRERVVIKATIKEHNIYRGVKQTIITRGKIVG